MIEIVPDATRPTRANLDMIDLQSSCSKVTNFDYTGPTVFRGSHPLIRNDNRSWQAILMAKWMIVAAVVLLGVALMSQMIDVAYNVLR